MENVGNSALVLGEKGLVVEWRICSNRVSCINRVIAVPARVGISSTLNQQFFSYGR